MKLVYDVKDNPRNSSMKFGQMLVFAVQQLLAIMAATIAVPNIVGNGLTPSSALMGAGVGTLVYLLFTKFRSPVFLGSSFAFIGSMLSAFAGGVSMQLGFLGLVLGAVFAGLVYVIIAIIVKFAGVAWIDKLMPPVVIGPTVAIIGLSLAPNAISDLTGGAAFDSATGSFMMTPHIAICILCGLVTLIVTMLCSVFGKKMVKLIPFILGILAGYAVATVFTLIGMANGNEALQIVDFTPFVDAFRTVNFESFFSVPMITFAEAFKGIGELNGSYIATIAVAYIPVAFVVFAEHLADHKNLSTIINRDLTKDPGLCRTLLGDGVGSVAGTLLGGCPNTTYGESIGCVAITKNASVCTILTTAVMCILIAFLTPFVCFLETIPNCVMGGVCIALYGFIAVSGLKMLQSVNLDKNRNLFTASVILIAGIGNFALTFGKVTLRTVAVALILGILTNFILRKHKHHAPESTEVENQIIK